MLKLLLQLFGEGGDGGDGASASTGEGGTMGEEIPAEIPTRARKHYQTAMQRTRQPVESQPTSETESEGSLSYEDLIKSDQYRDAHKAYMDRTISDRLKKYKGIEADFGKAKGMLEMVAQKYNVDTTSEGFLDRLSQALEADDSYYEDYAMEHDISTEDARRMVTMERKLKAMEAEKAQQIQQEQARQQILQLQKNAEQTKARFPGFDLETEMQDEKFRRLCAVNNGDTTAAYMACHWSDIMFNTAQTVTRDAQIATTNAIASGSKRPAENGLSSKTPSITEQTFRGMSLADIRKYADEQRRNMRRQ